MEKIVKQMRKWGGICLLLLAVGCRQEDVITEMEAGEGTFSLRCVAESMGGVRTRGAKAETPPVIQEYTVLIFKKGGTGTPAENLLVKRVDEAGSGIVTFTAQQDKSEHYIYVLANTGTKLDDIHEGSSEQQLLDMKDITLAPDGVVTVSSAPVMSSSKITLKKFNVSEFNNATNGGVVPLERNMARLTIRFSVDPAVFTPEEVTYIAMSGTSYLIERKNVNTGDYLNEVSRTNQTWEQPMYLYEQASLRNSESNAWKKPGFFLILKGRYLEGETQYFKFGLPAADGSFADIERNVSYALDVTDIKSNGYKTLTQAKDPDALFSNVSVLINPDMTGFEDFNEVYTNGYYMLGLKASEFHFYHKIERYPASSAGAGQIQDYLLTEVMWRSLDPSVALERPSLMNASSQLTLKQMRSGGKDKYYLLFKPDNDAVVASVSTYTAILSYGTLRKKIEVSLHPVVTFLDALAIKYQASNGDVHQFKYTTSTPFVQPQLTSPWTWNSADWCGLGSNRQFHLSNYFGEIKASLNENIFVHLRPVTGTIPDSDLRMVNLVAPDHVIEVRIGRNK